MSARQNKTAEDLAIQFRRTKNAQKKCFVKMYNALLAEIKRYKKIKLFKRMMKEG